METFPDARFLHIRRNPFEVFQSTMKMLSATLRFWRLQDTRCVDWEQRAIRQYREMFDVYFQERHLIRDGRLHEMTFEDLEADPITEVRRAYRELDLPPFEHVEPRLREYTAKLRGYQKNHLAELSGEMRSRLLREWNASFENWHYPTVCQSR